MGRIEIEIKIYPLGIEITKTDGTKKAKFLNGTKIILFPNGRTEIIDPNALKHAFGFPKEQKKKAA